MESDHIPIVLTYLRKEFQQTEDDERHRGRNRQAKLHEGKVDADVAATNVNVGQEDDEGDGRLQETAATTNHDHHWNTRRFDWRDLRKLESR